MHNIHAIAQQKHLQSSHSTLVSFPHVVCSPPTSLVSSALAFLPHATWCLAFTWQMHKEGYLPRCISIISSTSQQISLKSASKLIGLRFNTTAQHVITNTSTTWQNLQLKGKLIYLPHIITDTSHFLPLLLHEVMKCRCIIVKVCESEVGIIVIW